MDTQRANRGLGMLATFSVGLLLTRMVLFRDFTFGYMVWNLGLAAIPLALARILSHRLGATAWWSWSNLYLSALWLGFLPNSFYIVTDLIHLAEVGTRTVVFDAVMMLSFSVTGLLLGYAAVLPVHRALVGRAGKVVARRYIAAVFLLCGYAIYLGRYMRWNTWDVLINPIGLLSNMADSLTNSQYGAPLIGTTLLFFVFISCLYGVLLYVLPDALSGKRPRKQVK